MEIMSLITYWYDSQEYFSRRMNIFVMMMIVVLFPYLGEVYLSLRTATEVEKMKMNNVNIRINYLGIWYSGEFPF